MPARAVAGSRAPARAANHYWGDLKKLADHYARHGEGVGATSEEEYTRMAHEFYLNKKQYQVKVDKEGITRVYDAARNLFGSYNPDGTTRTAPEKKEPQAEDDQDEAQKKRRPAVPHQIEIHRVHLLAAPQGVLFPAHEYLKERTGHDDVGEHAGHEADGERDAEAAHRSGAEVKEDDGRDQRRDVRVEDRHERLAEAREIGRAHV